MSDDAENPGGGGEPGSFQKTIALTYSTILRSKMRNFLKRSILKYTFASLIYSAGLIIIRGGTLLSKSSILVFLYFFLIFISLSLLLMFLSSGMLAKKYRGRKMVYSFSEKGIHVLNRMNGLDESHGWDWIQSYEMTDKTLFLKIRSVKPFEIMLDRDKMTSDEIESLLDWLKREP